MLKKKYFIENSLQDKNASTKNIVESSDNVIDNNNFNKRKGIIPDYLFDLDNNINSSLEIRLNDSIKFEYIDLFQKSKFKSF
jgi:hypothetical protein